MALEYIMMYGTGDGGTDLSVATIDIPNNGTIVSADVTFTSDVSSSAAFAEGMISFSSANKFGTNDTRGVILVVATNTVLNTNGAHNPYVNKYVPLDLQVFAGERIHMHVFASSNVDTVFYCNFGIRFSTARRSTSRRRAS